MRVHEIESWALHIIDRVNSGQPIEDSRVELKSEWIDEIGAARRIAAHANASGGSPILWLIGVDEARGVTGIPFIEYSAWFAKLAQQFDGLVPDIREVNVPTRDRRGAEKTVAALLIETERAPFVVKNPSYGLPGGGPVQYEVPWRDGTNTRTARRDDLLRLLSPLQAIPTFEILTALLTSGIPDDSTGTRKWNLLLEMYANQTPGETVVIPFHRIAASIDVPPIIESHPLENVYLRPPYESMVPLSARREPKPISLTVEATNDEVFIQGPGKVLLKGTAETRAVVIPDGSLASVSITLFPSNAERSISISVAMGISSSEQDGRNRWIIGAR